MKNINSVIDDLTRYNAWRRGSDDIKQPDPTELGLLIEDSIEYLVAYKLEQGYPTHEKF